MSITKTLRSSENGIIILVLLAVSILPYFVAFSLPLPPYEFTTKAFNEVNSLKRGDIAVVSVDFDPGSWVDIGLPTEAVVQQMFNKGVKMVFISFYSYGPPLTERIINESSKGNATYGKDYVNLGFIPGFETGMAGFASNPRIITQDYYGTSIDNIPIMDSVHTLTDFKLFFFGTITAIDPWMRQFSGKLPIVLAIDEGGMALDIPWIQSGQLYSAIRGARGAAEYDQLLGVVGPALNLVNAASLTGIYALLLVVAGNFIFWRDRLSRGKK
jgi:hypothetical protein